ncbi:hypothetical protein PR048_031743 [Dryococelus australis]|uniref:Uncharacterized protein n=1 Tax=Dryococelus australis TaxID=614101 RepID=A0ABQ9G644_9NEOP|nr:hypothetical protein PR048_031743 [Dryococelus australis]
MIRIPFPLNNKICHALVGTAASHTLCEPGPSTTSYMTADGGNQGRDNNNRPNIRCGDHYHGPHNTLPTERAIYCVRPRTSNHKLRTGRLVGLTRPHGTAGVSQCNAKTTS